MNKKKDCDVIRNIRRRSTRISSLELKEQILGEHMSAFGVMVPADDGKMDFIKIFHADDQDDFCSIYGCMIDVANVLKAGKV